MLSDKSAEPFLNSGFWRHGITFRGHPVAAAVALRNLEIMEREDLIGNVQRNEQYFHDQLVGLMQRHDIVGDVRGIGYFKAIELVKDKATKQSFSPQECEQLLRGFLSKALFNEGMICRAKALVIPVSQLSPPLMASREELDEAIAI